MINYYLLTKPGIILGNLITLAAGFLLASKGHLDITLFLTTLLGLGFIIASACVFNNFIDRQSDRKMERTKNRALAKGMVSENGALCFGCVLAAIGIVLLSVFTNTLTVFVAMVGFVVYVFLYSLWKRKTIYGTAIGSIAGAVPPVVGYLAVSNHFDMGAFIFFMMLVLWQMPHFYAIALYHFDDYARAKIPALPLIKGIWRTKVHMAVYIAAFMAASTMLTLFNYTGTMYLWVATGCSLAWLGLALTGFGRSDNEAWGRQMFRLSLVLITAICLIIPFDVVW